MKITSLAIAAASLFAAASAHAEFVTLTFEDTSNNSSVAGAYPIGTFSDSAVYANDAGDNKAMFVNTALGATQSVFNAGSGGGFIDSLSFAYANLSGAVGSVSVWSGLDGSGTQLTSFSLGDNSASADLQTLSTWTSVSQAFSGTALSIVFGANDGNIVFDNVTVNAVPLPAAALLFPLGAAALGLARRKRQIDA
ncbi:MAG: hypothetical protein AB9M53_05700 [Leptothrix sp. (in: b-proteobacteria)]